MLLWKNIARVVLIFPSLTHLAPHRTHYLKYVNIAFNYYQVYIISQESMLTEFLSKLGNFGTRSVLKLCCISYVTSHIIICM